MQKKLYYLDESEKQRILNLHEDRTRKQYLIEQGLLGGGVKIPQTEIEKNWNESRNIVKKINDKCSTINSTDLNDSAYNKIKKNIENIKKDSSLLKTGTWNDLKNSLNNINLQNFCTISNTLKKEKIINNTLSDYLFSGIFSEDSFDTYFMKPLSNVLKEVEGEKIEANTDSTNPDTSETKNSEDKKTNSTSTSPSLGKWGNYFKQNLGLDDDNPSKPINNYKQGIGVVQQSKVGEFNQILKDLEVGDTLTQDAINKLYTKLGGK